jgi:DNA-binding PadR family transcriptional regulator
MSYLENRYIGDGGEFGLISRELQKGSTPTLVLAVLARAPMHGYQLIKELERSSGGVLRFKEGTLYPILHAFERDGLVEARWESDGARERKVYTLSPAGQAELALRTQEWDLFRVAVENVVKGGDGSNVGE